MKRTLVYLAASFMLLCAGAVQAAELLVSTFYESRPFKGLEIELDGKTIGETSDRGEVLAPIVAGEHKLRVLEDSAALAEYTFTLSEGQGADLTVGFTDFKVPPEFKLATYDAETGAAAGATGTVSGMVRDVEGNAIADAAIRIDQLDAEVYTDAAGSFELELPRGEYTLKISHPEHQPVTRDGLRVAANVGVAANIILPSKMSAVGLEVGSDVEEVVVFGSYKPTENATDLEKYSVTITDAISIDDLLRFGDSDVAAALKRIVGVAVTGGKYANVRGLAGRYISSTLNGSLMPSTDPFRRDVQLDLFPSEILGGIEIQKGFSANLPADTTGGAIRMTTRGIPDEDEAGISISLGYTDGATGEDLLSYRGGDSDELGFDDGTRELPGAVGAILPPGGVGLRICQGPITSNCVQQEAATAAATALPVIYNSRSETASPDFGVAAKFGRRHQFSGGGFGYYAALTYDQSHDSRQDARFEATVGQANGRVIWDSFNAAVNGYFVAGWEASAGWTVTSKTMLLRDTEDRFSIESGIDTTEDKFLVDTTLEWVERQFFGEQIESVIPLFDKHELSLRGGVSRTDRTSPDRRFYRYAAGAFSTSEFERSYADLSEDAWDLGADYLWPVTITDSIFTNVRFGLMLNRRDRDNQLIRLGVSGGAGADLTEDPESLLSRENFEDGTFRLRTRTDDTDSYVAVRETQAAYLSTETDFGAAWNLTLGARFEDYSLDLDYPYASNFAGGDDPSLVSDRDSSDVLPSANLVYRIGEEIQLRGGYSQTVSRPDITELAASIFFDAEGRAFLGCPVCEDSTIDNFDVRGEYYFSNNDSISLALFYKDIDAPIEVTVTEATNPIRTFRNGETAEVYGAELDASYKVYDAADQGFSVRGNLAWIESEITLDEISARVEGAKYRQLQGQSPFLANLQFVYDHYPFDTKITLVANYFDDRIDSVTRGQTEPIFEKGRIDLNLNAEKQFRGGSKVSLKIKNLLDAPIERTQSGRLRETYNVGTSLSLGYSLSF